MGDLKLADVVKKLKDDFGLDFLKDDSFKIDTTGDNDKIIPNKLEVAKSTEWKDFVASLKQIKDAPDITDGVIEQTDWNKINVISKNDWFKEQEDELLKQLKELGCDLKKDDNPNLDFFNFTDGKFKHTKDSEDPDSV